jgi:hypothetical protein
MILSVHQPQYLPWIGYFDKIKRSDMFVFLDDVQYKKREFQNRNRIRTKTGFIWLTVPVKTKDKYTQKINEVEIDNSTDWAQEHWKSIELSYSKSIFFIEYKKIFEKVYSVKWEKLVDINIQLVKIFLDLFNIKTPVQYESELNIGTTSTQRIVDLCKHYNADTYFSGSGGKEYMDETLFEKNNIKLVYQDFHHPAYKQVFPGFEPYMCMIDMLFNAGIKISW